MSFRNCYSNLDHCPVSDKVDVLREVVAVDSLVLTALHQFELVVTRQNKVEIELVNTVGLSVCFKKPIRQLF